MGKRYIDQFVVKKPLTTTQAFAEYVKGAFVDYPGYPVVFSGFKAVIRYRVGSIEPGYKGMSPGLRGPMLQTVISVRNGIYITLSTEYGFNGSGSNHKHGTAGHQQMIKILKEREKKVNAPKPAPAPAPKKPEEEPKKMVDVASQIVEMKKLLDAGVITQEEFDEFKKKVISSL